MIKYVIQVKKNPLKKEEVKFYPQAAPTTPVTLAQIVKRIEKRSTVSSADVKAVLDALQYEVIEALENGNTVRPGRHRFVPSHHQGGGRSNGRRSQDQSRARTGLHQDPPRKIPI